jgi:hypothetical protein
MELKYSELANHITLIKLSGDSYILGALSLIMILLAIRLRPDFHKGKRQTEVEEQKRVQSQEKKKKLPKRRKDYR